MNEEQITEVIQDDSNLNDTSSIDDVLQRHDQLKQEVIEIKEILEENFQTNEEVLEEPIEPIEQELTNIDIYWFITIGVMLGYIFVRGAFDIWKQ